MSQLSLDLSDINATRKDLKNRFLKKEISRVEYLDYDLKYLAAAATRENAIVQLIVSAAKHGKKILNQADRTNILDQCIAINTGDPEVEMIKCIQHGDSLITRQVCLDYSGGHLEQCGTCDQFGPTRRALLGPDDA